MTYYRGNPYKEPVTRWAHDECLPDSEFETVDLAFPDEPARLHRHQINGWNWSPRYHARDAQRRETCAYCPGRVE